MIQRDLISVIVPVHNVEDYIRQCIDSIILQTYTNLEVILVDDGSTDSSGTICDEYQIKDERIRVIHKINGGLSAARNVGIDACQGEYIGFVDSDDWIDKHMFAKLYAVARESGADIVACHPINVYGNRLQKNHFDASRCCTDKISMIDELFNGGGQTLSACVRLHKRHVFKTVRFPVGTNWEDAYTALDLVEECNKLVVLPDTLYYYRQRVGSITHQKVYSPHIFDGVHVYKRNYKIIARKYPTSTWIAQKRLWWSYCVALATAGSTEDYENYREEVMAVQREFRKLFSHVFKTPKVPLKSRLSAVLAMVLPPPNTPMFVNGGQTKEGQDSECNRKKKIGFVIYNLNAKGGAERVFSVIANVLTAHYEIVAISIQPCAVPSYQLDSRIKVLSISPQGKTLRVRDLLWPCNIVRLRKICKNEKLCAIICVSSVTVLALLSIIGCRIYRLVWEQTSYENKLYCTRKRRWQQRFGFLIADITVALTKRNVDYAVHNMFVRSDKITHIYNPVMPSKGVRKYTCDIKAKQIITISRIDPVKGLKILVRIAANVLKKHDDWRWNVYGQTEDAALYDELKQWISVYELTDRLILAGVVDDIETKLCASSICVMTSYYEGLPMSLLEAKSVGLPIVAFDCPTGPSEIVCNGVNGFLIDCYDEEQMAEKIVLLIENEELRTDMSHNASLDIDKFSLENIKRQWIDVIEKAG